MAQNSTDVHSLAVPHWKYLRSIPGSIWLMPVNDLGKETAHTPSKPAVNSTLVAGQWGEGKHSMQWGVKQPFGCQKYQGSLETKVQSPEALQCTCCGLLGLWSTGWGEDLQDRIFWVQGQTVEQAWTVSMEEHPILGNINAPWSGQGKGPLLGICETMPGRTVWLGVPQGQEKRKKLCEFHKGTPGWLRRDTETRDLFLSGLMRRRLQKDLISVFNYGEGSSMLFWRCTGRGWEVINE